MSRRLQSHPGAAGVDEAGRGPLAGPVAAAAVVIPKGFSLKDIDDSKKLTPEKRDELALRIKEGCDWAVVFVERPEIDQLNILWASMEAMKRAVANLRDAPELIFIDGNIVPRGLESRGRAVIGGDAKIACIAAASILAKTERDRLMVRMAEEYPMYGFENHFGYATPEHLEALRRHGPCPLHRRSFAPVREWEQPCLIFDE